MDEENSKKQRKRTKRLLNAIQKQLEFYFGDANLRHDTFLRKEIVESVDSFIPLKLLLKFNKLKELCTDTVILSKAVENSELLQLSDDREKVKRIHTIPAIENTDGRTVYVEQLQAYHDHDWLKDVFSTCGTVEYISLPRHKHNNHIKGFAFIEFSNISEAEKACRVLNTAAIVKNKTKKRQSADVRESEATENENNPQTKRKRKRSVSVSETSDADSTKTSTKKETSKRNRSISESGDHCTVKTKRRKKSGDEKPLVSSLSEIKVKASIDSLKHDEGVDKPNIGKIETESKKRKHSEDLSCKQKKTKTNDSIEHHDTTVEIEDTEDDSEKTQCTSTNKRSRKHTKKSKNDKEIIVPPLYVISKTKWLSMKKQYKALQRTEIGHLKKQMRVLKSEKVRRKELKEKSKEPVENKETSEGTLEETITTLKEKELPEETTGTSTSKEKQLNMNGSKEKSVRSEERIMVSGSVAMLETSVETLKRPNIKKILCEYADVAYVDYTDGCPSGYIRATNAEQLEKLFAIKESVRKLWEFSLKKLTEEEENSYLEKAAEDRRKTYQKNMKKVQRRNTRGKEKIFKDVDRIEG